MLSFLLLALIADTAPIHTTVADSTRVAFIAQTPISLEVLTVSTFFLGRR